MNFAPRIAYWAGNGGSLSYVDLDARMSVGFAPNRWVRGEHENDSSFRIMAAVYESLQAKWPQLAIQRTEGRIRVCSLLVPPAHP
jgi:hypothetical protein